MRVKIGRVISHQQDILRLNATTCLVEEVEGTLHTDIQYTQTHADKQHTHTHKNTQTTGTRTNKHVETQKLVEDADDTVRSTRLILFCWAVRQRDGE